MDLAEKVAVGLLALGLAVGGVAIAKGVDTKNETIACSNMFPKYNPCKPKHCRQYCRESLGKDNRIEQVTVVDKGQSCLCTYTPKQITVDRKCENLILDCSANDCDEQCRAYVATRDGTFQSSASRKSSCACTYRPK